MDWQSMETAPKDGTTFDVLCKSKDGVEVVVPELKYGHAPMDKTKFVLWGTKNMLSSYLTPIGWKERSNG